MNNIEGIDPTAYFLSAIKPNSFLPQMLRIAAKSTEANQDRIHLIYVNLKIELTKKSSVGRFLNLPSRSPTTSASHQWSQSSNL